MVESMEEQESVEPRETVVGLSVLGLLLLALVGSIFYRIVNPSPPTKVLLEDLVIAPAPGGLEPPTALTPPAALAGESYQIDGEVNAATFGAEGTTRPVNQGGPAFVAPATQ